MKEEKEKEDVPKPKDRFVVGEVPTQHERVVYDQKTEKQYDLYGAIAKIMNDVEAIKKGLI